MNSKIFLCLLLFCIVLSLCNVEATSLQSYKVDPKKTTVSGVSSGGYAAVQYHVTYSSEIYGAGITAGGPFWCANDNVEIALHNCMKDPVLISVTELETITFTTHASGFIDNPKHLANDRVFLISGQKDSVVKTGVVKKLEEYYEKFVDSDSSENDPNLKTDFSLPAEHAWLTSQYGKSCGHLGEPYINDCDYDTAGKFFNHFYANHGLKPAGEMIQANLKKFSQTEFVPTLYTPTTAGLADDGFVYVPSNCQDNSATCWLHISLHGCEMGVDKIGDKYARYSGINDWAETNNVIVLYPQARTTTLNPKGCWDWWGYTGPQYASNVGAQNVAIHKMMKRIIG
eukprot:gb/GECH01011634.1/.p1 GENE.gb/GECH01011634.1/~~gb/GECH01011634.1/.p1  ORF type:complete len:342 (+),score=60.29 gb/GECH01011634.1/:1-1026(+)